MLTNFKVSNFKNFKNEFILDLTDTRQYEFNVNCIKNGNVNKALIYGRNAAGKSNLGYAIFDLISHLTDNNVNKINYKHYLNASSNKTVANFEYQFQFEDNLVVYKYGKYDLDKLVYENLTINSVEYLSIDKRITTKALIKLKGTETLNLDMGESSVSLINYIRKNAVLPDNKINNCFFNFLTFIEGMLFFRSLKSNRYMGYQTGNSSMMADIIERNNVKDFEDFLQKGGVACELKVLDDNEEPSLAFKFGNKKLIPFYDIASTGTQSLTTFYYWLQKLKNDSNIKFVFIDEFDAFYHHELSTALILKLRELEPQIILTTHNTNIMTNDLLRPDCNFIMDSENIHSLPNCTDKEIRSAHNIEKMYRAGVFDA